MDYKQRPRRLGKAKPTPFTSTESLDKAVSLGPGRYGHFILTPKAAKLIVSPHIFSFPSL